MTPLQGKHFQAGGSLYETSDASRHSISFHSLKKEMENIPICHADFLKIPIGIGTSKHGGFGHSGSFPLKGTKGGHRGAFPLKIKHDKLTIGTHLCIE